MTLGGELDLALKPGAARASQGGVSVSVDVQDADRIGISAGSVRVVGAAGGVAGAVERVPAAVSRALGEKVVATEVDPALGGAVFRTDPAHMRDREFTEVRAEGDATTVERYRVTDAGRDKIPFAITRRALERLVDDLAGG